MTYVLTEIAMEMMGLKFYDMDGEFCETNFQGEDKKRKDKPNLLQVLGLKRDEKGMLVNDPDNDDEKPTTSSRLKKQTQAAGVSGRRSGAKAGKNKATANVKKMSAMSTKKSQMVNAKKSEAATGELETTTAYVKQEKIEVKLCKVTSKEATKKVASTQSTDVKQATAASKAAIKKIPTENVKLTTDTKLDADIQNTEVNLAVDVSKGAIKKVPTKNVKIAAEANDVEEQTNVKIAAEANDEEEQNNEVKPGTDASKGAIKKVSAANAELVIDAELKPDLTQTIDLKTVPKNFTAGNIKLTDEFKKQYKLRKNPILNKSPVTDAIKKLEDTYATKFSALDLNTTKEETALPIKMETTPLISVRSDLVALPTSSAQRVMVPASKRGNSLVKRTTVEFERLRSLLLKHKNDYININGNIHHRMVLMGAYSPEKFMQPSLESEEKNLKVDAEMLYKYRCLLEASLERSDPEQFKRIHTRYTLRKRMAYEE